MSALPLSPPDRLVYEALVRTALAEDLGQAGDVTSALVVEATHQTEARFVARKPGRIAGLPMAGCVMALIDPTIKMVALCRDGQDVEAGTPLATVSGPARAILTAERTALNLLGRLSGIATTTRGAVAVASPHGADVTCTRKTVPGLRALDKYAVRAGGGKSHRHGLDDGILIKDNHIAMAGGIDIAIRRALAGRGHMTRIEVEVDTLEQLDRVLAYPVDAVLLDNMAPETLREAVSRVGGRLVTEASGGITPEEIATVAATGVNVISLGWLTHTVTNLDIALDG